MIRKNKSGEVLETLFKTTHQLHRLFENNLSKYETPVVLTGPRLRLLVTVLEAGEIRMSDIALKLGIQPRTVTQFVDALEKEKYLIRMPDPVDRRATLLKVADHAINDINQARASMSLAAEETLKNISQEDQEQILNILKLIGNLEDIN
ncbi:MarR family winged helix-turn-helix transcriptional regulator [Gottfriedia solisilvae]|uniref:MarR family winged helix-turn-helix transcriptional regulator n=1 Tax=Gottfriedia solisilvae TaxID=1516104 RepID=UPI003D2F23EE